MIMHLNRLIMPALMLISTYTYAQLDVRNIKKIQVGAMYDNTKVMGLYALQNPNNGQVELDLKDERTTINGEIKVMVSQKNYINTANLEGFVYILGRLASLAQKKELFNDFDTPLDPLSAGDCKNIKFQSGAQYNEVARFSNNHIVDITSSFAIQESPFFVGINGSLRTIGFPPRYTNYKTEKPADRYAICTLSATWKVLYGLNLGLRKNFGEKIAFIMIAGLNTGINSKKSSAIQVRYSPFINPTFFFGKKTGGYVGLYYEMMNCKDATAVAPLSNLVVGVPSPNQSSFKTKVSESQILIKLGFYFTSKKENK